MSILSGKFTSACSSRNLRGQLRVVDSYHVQLNPLLPPLGKTISVVHAAPVDHGTVSDFVGNVKNSLRYYLVAAGQSKLEADQGPELGFYATTGASELSCSCLAATWSWGCT